jgi:3-oxoadipate enol-lactonase
MSPGTPAECGFVEVGTTRLYREAWGAAGAPLLLCLHGLGGSTAFFGALGARLSGQCRTVAVDLPGSGLSPRLDAGLSIGFSFDAVADLLVSLASRERVSAPAVSLLGHSMGTILALEMIRRSRDLAIALIVVGGLPEPLTAARRRLQDRIAAIRQHGIAAVSTDVVAANFARRSQAERPELTACFAKLFAGQDPGAYADTASALAAWTAREPPPLERVSCLAVTGDEDRYAPPDAVRDFAQLLPASTEIAIMRDCGHLPFLERPAEFGDVVSAFLRKRCHWG